jgi:hypothetical protein
VGPDEGATTRRWASAWATLCLAFAIHVLDEAANDFLSGYNLNALALRARFPWLPVPVFTFGVWISGLTIAVVGLAALTPLVRRGRRWLVPVAYVYGVIHIANAIGHITLSLVGRWFAPGVFSSPVLLASALWLVYETARLGRANASPAPVGRKA